MLAVIKEESNPMWILCDNESTVDIFKNTDLITNIRETKRPICLKGIKGNTCLLPFELFPSLGKYHVVLMHNQPTKLL